MVTKFNYAIHKQTDEEALKISEGKFKGVVWNFKDVEFLFYEQIKHKDIAKVLNIKFWTTIVVYKGQKEITREIGLNKKEDIYKIIKMGI